MRKRERLQHHAFGLRRSLEFVKQPRLSNSRLTQCGNDLPVPRPGQLQCAPDLLGFALAPDEPGEPALRRKLKACAQQPQPGHFVDVDRLAHAFDSHRAQRREAEVAVAQLLGLLRHRDRTNRRLCLHPRGQIRGMTDRGVLDMSVTRGEWPDHDFGGCPAARRRAQ